MLKIEVEEAAAVLASKLSSPADIGIVLGSGLAPLADAMAVTMRLPTTALPHYPPSTVVGHEGTFLGGSLAGRSVLMLKGRIHGYEGYDLSQVTMPVRLMALVGVKTLILTNAAGGLNTAFAAGDVMLIEDHLNLQGASPLCGPNVEEWGVRFPDMTTVYDLDFRMAAMKRAAATGFTLRHGIYASCQGPQYETPAEVRMLRGLGADAVGMSTVPEAIVARHMGLRVLGFSVVSNLAAGISPEPLAHEDVVAAGQAVGPKLSTFLRDLLPHLA